MSNITITVKGHLFNVVATLAGDNIDFVTSPDPTMGTQWTRTLQIQPGTIQFAANLQGLSGTTWTATITEGSAKLLDESGTTDANYSLISDPITVK